MVRNSYHLIKYSPWPIMGSTAGFILVLGMVGWFHKLGYSSLSLGMILILCIMVVWWRDVIRESWLEKHTKMIQTGLRTGMILFIVSEVFFFFSFFWAYFTSSLCPTMELGCVWPPVGLEVINAFSVPLCNTAILLWSGFSLTLSHASLKKDSLKWAIIYLDNTWLMGLLFIFFQAFEYKHATFSISDSVYGSVFFVATGFHGLHVIIGTIFLIVSAVRMWSGHFLKGSLVTILSTPKKKEEYIVPSMHVSAKGGQMVGFEAAIWYWHFVDVVWIFLFLTIYWWGS